MGQGSGRQFRRDERGVLTPEAFGLGPAIIRKAIDFAKRDERISYITFLLPPSRKNLGALERLGAIPVGAVEYDGAEFRKFRLAV